MDAGLVKLASLLTAMVVAAITPGPNNFVVLTVSGRGGLRAALGPIAGVVAGSLALLLIVWTGADYFASALPGFRLLIGLVGGGYLAWLGLMLIIHASESKAAPRVLPTGTVSMAFFQLLNPKTWMFISAVTAAGLANPADVIGLPLLLLAVPAVMIGCLLLWAAAGSVLSEWLSDPGRSRRFNQLMGLLLLVSAPLLIL